MTPLHLNNVSKGGNPIDAIYWWPHHCDLDIEQSVDHLKLYSSPLPFLNWVFSFLLSRSCRWIVTPHQIDHFHIFSSIPVVCLFSFLMVSFHAKRENGFVIQWRWTHLFLLLLWPVLWVQYWGVFWHATSTCWKFSQWFLLQVYSLLGLLVFVCGNKHPSLFICIWISNFPSTTWRDHPFSFSSP